MVTTTPDIEAIRKRAEDWAELASDPVSGKHELVHADTAASDLTTLISHIAALEAERKAEMLGVIEFGCSYVRRFWTEKHFSEPLKSYDDILAAYLAQKEKKDV